MLESMAIIYLFWNYEINLMENTSKKLNAKAYAMTIKKDKALNQWLKE